MCSALTYSSDLIAFYFPAHLLHQPSYISGACRIFTYPRTFALSKHLIYAYCFEYLLEVFAWFMPFHHSVLSHVLSPQGHLI